jgi:hypothetical protein
MNHYLKYTAALLGIALLVGFGSIAHAQNTVVPEFNWDFGLLSEDTNNPSFTVNSNTGNYQLTVEALGNYNWRNNDNTGPSIDLSSDSGGGGLMWRNSSANTNNRYKLTANKDIYIVASGALTNAVLGDFPTTDWENKYIVFENLAGEELAQTTSWSYASRGLTQVVQLKANEAVYLRHVDSGALGGDSSWGYLYGSTIPEPQTYALIFGSLSLLIVTIKCKLRKTKQM